MAVQKTQKKQFLTYKGIPLVRCGDIIYYGDLKEAYVIKLEVKTKKTFEDLELADKISIQLMSTNSDLSSRKKIIKTSEKQGLYLALDIAEVWLSRALKEANQ